MTLEATIIRSKSKTGFFIAPNAAVEDESLGTDAVAFLMYLLSKPDNWEVSMVNLQKRFSVGRDKARSAMSSLKRAGYVDQNRVRVGGRFRYEYIIYDTAQPSTEKPSTENTSIYKERILPSKEYTNKGLEENNTGVSAQSGTFDLKNPEAYTEPPENQTKSKSGYTVEFSHVWENWGSSHKVRKKVAAKRFEAKPKRERAAISALVDASPWRRPADKIPAIANWLRDEDVSEIADHIEGGGQIMPEAANKRRQSVQDDYMDMVAEIKETPADGSNFGAGVDIFA